MEIKEILNSYENISQRYLNFVLTTICRQNKKLYDELEILFKNNEILSQKLIVQKSPEYLCLERSDINKMHFNNCLKEYLMNNWSFPYKHQIEAWNIILSGKDCIISTGTGSGKTEAFLFPIIDYCMNNKNNGIKAIIIYPMKALANDQGKRIGKELDKINIRFNTNIKYGIFDADSPENNKSTTLRKNSGNNSEVFYKDDILSNPPDILLTNYVMLERLMLNPKYSIMLKTSNLKYLCLDEIHYYSGAQGIDVSLLIRRLQFRFKDNKEIQFIGTSATLSNIDNSFLEINSFLKNIFNKEFSQDQIVFPTFTKDHLTHPLKTPRFYKECSEIIKSTNKIKAHAFFKSSCKIYRCLNCGKLHLLKEEKCSCNSNLIFEISTCRQCGEEYFIYNFEVPENMKSFVLTQLDLIESLKLATICSKKIGTLYFTLNNKFEHSYELKLYRNTLNIYHPSINIQDCLNIYAIGIRHNDISIDFLEKCNNNYCPNCYFEDARNTLIAPVDKISDENCSHIVFDEAFMSLNKDKRKLLIFTDNVQRTSKFAREIEETHFKNIARTILHKNLNKLEGKQKLSLFLFNIIDEIKTNSIQGIDIDTENNIKLEIYDEILSTGRKVASLANRNLFSLSIHNSNNIPSEKVQEYNLLLPIFTKGNLIYDYFKLIQDDEDNKKQFLSKSELLKNIYKKIHNLEKKKIKENNFPEAEIILEELKKYNLLQIIDDNYFLKESFIEIEKNRNYVVEENNYYESWINFENIPQLESEMDTGKTKPDKRSETEKRFKEENNMIVVATSTLELGIDIGDLDAVGLLYSPPSAAQYVQRVGRCGRKRNESSLAISYMSTRSLDETYFENPQLLVTGEINPPKFKLELEIPQKKSLFSLFLEYLITKTSFKDTAWKKISFWVKDTDFIKSIFIENIDNFILYVESYIKNINFNIDKKDLIYEWCERLNSTRLTSDEYDIFSYLKDIGLLPDYAFGSGGSMLLVSNCQPIIGFSLNEICPPSTLDHNKSRYRCNRISLENKNIKIHANNYKTSLYYSAIYTEDNKFCSFSNENLVEKRDEIIEPKIIYGKRSTFNLKTKRIIWNNFLVNPPKYSYDGIISPPFLTTVATLFPNQVWTQGKLEKESFYFNYKGECTENRKDKLEKIIGSFLKTRAIIVNCSNIKSELGKTFINTIISAATFESGCEDGEINGFFLDENNTLLVLYDNVEGGVGFVDIIYDDFNRVLNRMIELCKRPCCKMGCVRCIGSYSRQRDLDYLAKDELLKELDNFTRKKVIQKN